MSGGGAETQLAYVPDHADRAEALLLSQDRTKPRIRALARALAAGTQMMEDLLFSLIVDRAFDYATGDALEQWGALVGEKRGPLEDRDYRRFVAARILVNRSGGSVDELVAVWALLMDVDPAGVGGSGLPPVMELDFYPATYWLQAERGTPLADDVARRVGRTMDDARPMGVADELVEYMPDAALFAVEGHGWGEGTWGRVL